ncbi:RBBP9/YdeN family alpha/beta hydrolase (plasmid) [Microvirga sp. RSM25]|uniref:RBBP9/YdeN family alpha/beta hydrolase n=1 Tax=Microvirga sp. RSM25 TaxID=3273802 RepID=UPI00385027B2
MTILMIPGFKGSEPEHWQSRWEAALHDVERVQQEHWDAPDLDVWLAVLVHHVKRRPGALLVGHSLGATLIAHLALRHPDLDIGGALLVAPADPDLRRSRVPGIASFGPLPIEPFGFPAILVASRTDPHMAQERARIIANLWEAAFVDAGDAGHINVASGHGAWPEGLPWLARLQVRQHAFAQLPLSRPSTGSRHSAP